MKRKRWFNKKLRTKWWLIVGSLTTTISLSGCFEYAYDTVIQPEINLGDKTKFATFNSKTNDNNQMSFAVKNLITNLLKNTEIKYQIIPLFAKELIYSLFQKQVEKEDSLPVGAFKFLRETYQQVVNDVEKKYHQEKNSAGNNQLFQQKILDFHGGNSATYRRRQIVDQLYEKFFTKFATLQPSEFSLVEQYQEQGDLNPNDHGSYVLFPNSQKITKETLENPDNWPKIRFYPSFNRNQNSKNNQKFSFNLINFKQFAYEKWLAATKPFHVVMSLWKYDDKATANDLQTIYQKDVLKGYFPTKASYQFPFFTPQIKDQSKNTTTTKFQQFVNNLNSLTPTKKKQPVFTISKNYTDDSTTAIYAEGQSIFHKLYPQFAAGAIHKFLQLTTGKDVTDREKIIQDVNPISWTDLKKKDLINLFLEEKTDSLVGIPINQQIFNPTTNYQKSFVLDQRDLTNSPWMFLRNKSGVHAIAIDGYHYIKNQDCQEVTCNDQQTNNQEDTAQYLNRSYQFFNFKTLQKIKADELGINNAWDTNPLETANTYFQKHFATLLVDYYLTKITSNNGSWLFENLPPIIPQILAPLHKNGSFPTTNSGDQKEQIFQKLLSSLITISYAADKLKNPFDVSEKMQSEYLNWNLQPQKTNNNYFSALENGLASVLPYSLAVNDQKNGTPNHNHDLGRYLTLDPIYTNDKFEQLSGLYNYSQAVLPKPQNDLNDHKSLHTNLLTNLTSLISQLPPRGQNYKEVAEFGTSSKAIFTNSYFFDRILDVYINNATDNLNNFFTTYYLTNDYLKNYFDPQENKVKNLPKNKSSSLKNDGLQENGKLENAIKDYYYGKTYQQSKNPLVYGSYLTNTSKKNKPNDATEQLAKLTQFYESIFDHNFYYHTNKGFNIASTDNVEYLNFLRTLVYLIKDNYHNLILHLKSVITPNTKAGFAWITTINKKLSTNLEDDNKVQQEFMSLKPNYQNRINNPFINSSLITNFFSQNNHSQSEDDFNDNLLFAKTATSFLPNKNDTTFDHNYRGFSGLIVKNPQGPWKNPDEASFIEDFHNNNQAGVLFNFNSISDLINYVKNFDSVSDIDNLVNQLKKLVNQLNTSVVTSAEVIIDNQLKQPVSVHVLTFKEKLNALLSLLTKQDINYQLKMSLEQFQKIYGEDNHQANNSHLTPFFNRFTGILQSANNTAITGNKYAFATNQEGFVKLANVIQFNRYDLNSDDSFSNFISKYLSHDTFAKWLVQLAHLDFFQSQSKTDFERLITDKLTVHDIRFQKHLAAKYVTNKH